MHDTARLLATASIAAAASLAGACDVSVNDGRVSVDVVTGVAEREERRSYAIGPDGQLEIENRNGAVEVSAWDGPGVEVTSRAGPRPAATRPPRRSSSGSRSARRWHRPVCGWSPRPRVTAVFGGVCRAGAAGALGHGGQRGRCRADDRHDRSSPRVAPQRRDHRLGVVRRRARELGQRPGEHRAGRCGRGGLPRHGERAGPYHDTHSRQGDAVGPDGQRPHRHVGRHPREPASGIGRELEARLNGGGPPIRLETTNGPIVISAR